MWIYPGPVWAYQKASWSLLQKDAEPLALEIYDIIWRDDRALLSNVLRWSYYRNNPPTTIGSGDLAVNTIISPLEWAISGAL